MINLETIRKFLTAITGEENPTVQWQTYYDPKEDVKRPDLASTFHATLDGAAETLNRAQNNKCGVFITLNQTDGKGRKIENITGHRVLFADFDNRSEPVWPITPTIVTKRDNLHGHAFWCVSDIEDNDQFIKLQKRIAHSAGTDISVFDPARVCRVPGTEHFKDPDDIKSYEIIKTNTDAKYKVTDIMDNFHVTPDQEKLINVDTSAKLGGAGFVGSVNDQFKYTKHVTEYAEPAVAGSGSLTLIKVASLGYDYGLPLEVTQEILWQHYDPRCIPSWRSTDEMQDFYETVSRAYRIAKNEPGTKTAAAAFTAVPPLPAKPTPRESVLRGDRITKKIASSMEAMINDTKAPHYDMAKVFDGVLYEGTGILCYMGVYYTFNGRAWHEKGKDVIKSEIQRFYSRLKPADSLVVGILKSLTDLVNIGHVENGMWLSDGRIEPNWVCAINGLFNMETDEFIPHTPDYFTLNENEFVYDPSATCPTHDKFSAETIPDLATRNMKEEFEAYAMTADTSMQKFMVYKGKPRGGKGVHTSTLTSLVGKKNTSAPALSNLSKDSTLDVMLDSRLALIPDAHSVGNSAKNAVTSALKAIIGGDAMTVHRIWIGAVTKVAKCKIIMSANEMPDFHDPSGALLYRMLVVPFTKSFAGKEDYTLQNKLDSELSGIFNKLIIAYKRLLKRGRFLESDISKAEKEYIREDTFPLARFIDDMCVISSEGFAASIDIFENYMSWAKQHNVHYTLTQNQLVKMLAASDLPILRKEGREGGKRMRGFSGINILKFPEPAPKLEVGS